LISVNFFLTPSITFNAFNHSALRQCRHGFALSLPIRHALPNVWTKGNVPYRQSSTGLVQHDEVGGRALELSGTRYMIRGLDICVRYRTWKTYRNGENVRLF